MHLFVQACILGLLTGGVYALMASGLTLAFGIMRVIHVAQGALIVLGAYLSYTLFTHFQIDPFVGVLVIAPAMFVLGVCLQLVFLRLLREDEREELSLLVTWAIALGIEGVLSYIYNTTYRSTNTGYANRAWDVGGYLFPQVRVYAFALSIGIIALLYVVLARTRFGRSVRATVQHPVSARLLGVGAARAVAVIGVLAAFPLFAAQHWVEIGVLTLMYAALATAWNLVGGYAGYVSLGHVAFFGAGAYAVSIAFTRYFGIGAGYRPFYVLPLVGLGVALASVPVGWIAFRTRAATFAIVTLTLLFVVQQLAFNLRSLTQGSQGILLPQPSFPNSDYEQPFYYAMLGLLVLGLLVSRWIRASKLGLTLFAIRDDEDRARGLGERVTLAKLIA